jgi:hypothetical protein
MLDFNVTEQDNSIEELFAKEFEKTEKYPMDDFTTEMLVKLTLSKNTSYAIPEGEKPFLYKLMEKRIEVLHDFELDERTLLFLCCICKSAGVSVMYIWYLQYKSKKRNIKEISLESFCEIFPVGFPSEDDLHRMWDNQKVLVKGMGSDNLLDYPYAGKSLF